MLQFALLGSSSSGNATLVSDGSTHLLIDNGLSYKRLEERLGLFNLHPRDLSGVLVTHEHNDHILGLGVLNRRHDVPIFVSRGTAQALPPGLGEMRSIAPFEAGDGFEVGGLAIQSFSVSHDAADPVNYTITNRSTKLGFATDFGHCSQLIRARLAGSHALVVESNYCPDMLRLGSYPPAVRQRISSRIGHLSNHDAARLIAELCHDSLQLVVLVHLSRENNCPDVAARFAREALPEHPAEIVIAPPDGAPRLFEVRA